MDNPYWATEGQTHHIEVATIERLCFELVSLFEASHRLADLFVGREEEDRQRLDTSDDRLFTLHRNLAENQATQLLLQLALLLRTYDDLMSGSEHAEKYKAHAEATSGEDYIGGLEDGAPFDLREVCNKIIHARTIRCLYEDVDRSADADDFEHSGAVQYLTGEIELKGRRGKDEWSAELHSQAFLEITLDRIAFKPD